MNTNLIRSTKNYDLFRFTPGNRPVTDATVKIKIRAMQKRNLLQDNPILVEQRLDGLLYILDGQNRFKAAQHLDLPVHYKFAAVADADDVAGMNEIQKGWKPKDYLARYVGLGNPHYRALSKFIAETKIPMTIAADLLAGNESWATSSGPSFRGGRFEVRDLTHAGKVANVIRIIGHWIPWAADRSLVLAVSKIIRAHKAFSIDRFSAKLQLRSRSLVKCANWLQYVELIEEIYNFAVKAKEIASLRDDVRRFVAESEKPA